MQPKSYNLLRWLLIVMLTISPLRAVIAGNSICEKGTNNDITIIVTVSEDAMDHHDMAQHNQQMNSDDDSVIISQCCCCDDGHESCASNCDMGISVSLILQELTYAAVVLDVSKSKTTTSTVLLRELTPPSRPPASIS